MKRKKGSIVSLAIGFLCLLSQRGLAETVLEKIQRTETLTVGARNDAVPFGFIDKNEGWTGYSVDLLQLIHQRLEQELGKSIKLEMQPVTIDDRFEKVTDGSIDIVCGATTITQPRLQQVDFSLPFFVTGTQFLLKLADVPDFSLNGTLRDVRVAYIPHTTTDEIIRQIFPLAQWQAVNNRQQGILALKSGKVTAVASDGILLIGELVASGNDPRQYALVPRQPMTTELYGCILPKNNPDWKEFVDQSIVTQDNKKLQEKWFNLEKGTFPYVIRTNLSIK